MGNASFVVGGALLLAAQPALASVGNVTPNGFISSHVVALPGVSPAQAYQSFVALPRWWDPAHSYSGKSGALRFVPEAGACWCEQLEAGGSVEHMRVQLVLPSKRLVMSGGLGPLLYSGVAATMDVTFSPSAEGAKVSIVYRVAGFPAADAATMASPVDKVLAAGLARYASYARSSVTKVKGSEPSPGW